METVDEKTDFQAFEAFYKERHASSAAEPTLEEAVVEFRTYQAQLKKLRERITAAEQSGRVHGLSPITDDDLEEMFTELDDELRREGAIE